MAPSSTASVEERTQIGTGPTAMSTCIKTTVATDGGSEAGADELVVETINADAADDDRRNLNDEYVVFSNIGDEALDLSGWTVRDEADKTYTFPDGFDLEAGASVRQHAGSGTDTVTNLYWEASQSVWNNDGATVIVETAAGETDIREEY